MALWYPRQAVPDEPNGGGARLYGFSSAAAGEAVRQLMVQQVALPVPVPGERWIDAMTAEVRAQLGLLLGASVGLGARELSVASA